MTLSGRVDTLEIQVSNILQDMLQKPDTIAYSSLSTNWNQTFDLLDARLDTIRTQLATIQSLYSNLYFNVQTNYTILTGHTGATGHGA